MSIFNQRLKQRIEDYKENLKPKKWLYINSSDCKK